MQEKFISMRKAPVKENMAIMKTQPMARRLAQGMESTIYSKRSEVDAFKADHPNHRQGGVLKFPLEFSFLSGEVGAGEFLMGQRCARRVQVLLRKVERSYREGLDVHGQD